MMDTDAISPPPYSFLSTSTSTAHPAPTSSSSSSSWHPSPHDSSRPFAHQIQSHLCSLNHQEVIRQRQQQQQQQEQQQQESNLTPTNGTSTSRHHAQILTHLVTLITQQITAFTYAPPPRPGGKRRRYMTLVIRPERALEQNDEMEATPCLFDVLDMEVTWAVNTTLGPLKLDKDTDSTQLELEDDLWWRDEGLAVSLADALNPTREDDGGGGGGQSNVEVEVEKSASGLSQINDTASLTAAKTESPSSTPGGGIWRRFSTSRKSSLFSSTKSSPITSSPTISSPPPPPPPTHPITSPPSSNSSSGLTTTAEEIVFRTQDGMGLYGTVRGWCLVVRLDREGDAAVYVMEASI